MSDLTKENKPTEVAKVDPIKFGVTPERAQQAIDMFGPMLGKMSELEKDANEILSMPEDLASAKLAKEIRLKLVKVRTGTDAIHKDLKKDALNYGKFLDSWRNTQRTIGTPLEEKLKAREDFIKREEERIEAERLEKVAKLQAERKSILKPFQVNEFMTIPTNLGEMESEAFEEMKSGWEAFWKSEQEKKRLEAERLEKERKENERIEAEKRAETKRVNELHEKRAGIISKVTGKKILSPNLGKMSEDEFALFYADEVERVEKEKELEVREAELEAKEKAQREKEQRENARKEAEAKAKADLEAKKKKEAEDKARAILEAGDVGVVNLLKERIQKAGSDDYVVKSENAKGAIDSALGKLREAFSILNNYKA